MQNMKNLNSEKINAPAILKNYLFLRIFCLFYFKFCLFRPNFIKQKYDVKCLNSKMTENIIKKNYSECLIG